MTKLLSLTLLASISLTACAQSTAGKPHAPAAAATSTAQVQGDAAPAAGTPEARAAEAIRALNPDLKVERVGQAAMPGFREVIVGGQTAYVSDDGRYLVQGSLYDLKAKKDLSRAAMAALRRDLLAKVPQSDRIVFAPANPRYTVAVFTDVECGYCRKLHSQIADYNKLGIAVEYLAFPRMGLGSEDSQKMVDVWCAADRKSALTISKNDGSLPRGHCANPVAAQYALGQRLGLTGTPMIIAANGMEAPGYLAPAALKTWLDAVGSP